MSGARGPSFFVVGAPKCGTTALQDYLAQSPMVFFPEGKEFHHFADDLLRPDDPLLDRDRYLALFAGAAPSQVIGEASAFHLLSTVAAQRLRAYRHDARILVMLRNPLDVVPALHAQLVFNGEEPLTSLEAALDAEPARRRGEAIPPRARFGRKLCYVDVARFTDQVRRFLDAFAHVHVIWHDDFRRDTAREVARAAAFVGVDPSFPMTLPVVNANKRVRSRAVQELLLAPPAPLVALGRRLMPQRLLRAARRVLMRANAVERPREPLPDRLSERLLDELAPDVEHLGRLLGRDLSAWVATPRSARVHP